MGGTVFSLADLHWFGFGLLEVPKEERVRRLTAELERVKRAGPPPNATQREKSFHRFLASRKDLRSLAETWADGPTIAPKKNVLDQAAERRIAELKRDLEAWSREAGKAAKQHEEYRQELLSLLAKHHISADAYPEAKNLRLDD